MRWLPNVKPPAVPTKHPDLGIAAEIERYTRAGLTVPQTSMLTGIAKRTLQRHYGNELKTARLHASAMLGESVYARGLAGDNACAFFWLKCRARWTEIQRTEITGTDGAPLIPPSPQVMLIPISDPSTWRSTVAKRQAELAARIERMAHGK